MPETDHRPDLESLGARLQAAKARHQPQPRDVAVGALAKGTRYAVEIAANTLVGAGIGWALDRWLGTGPWLFILFLLLGVGGGFWSLVKAVDAEAAEVRKRAEENDTARQRAEEDEETGTARSGAGQLDDQG